MIPLGARRRFREAVLGVEFGVGELVEAARQTTTSPSFAMRAMVAAVTPAARRSVCRDMPRSASGLRAIERCWLTRGIDTEPLTLASYFRGFVSIESAARRPKREATAMRQSQ